MRSAFKSKVYYFGRGNHSLLSMSLTHSMSLIKKMLPHAKLLNHIVAFHWLNMSEITKLKNSTRKSEYWRVFHSSKHVIFLALRTHLLLVWPEKKVSSVVKNAESLDDLAWKSDSSMFSCIHFLTFDLRAFMNPFM